MATGEPAGVEPTSTQILLGEVDGAPFEVDPQTIVTGRTAIVGSSGSGKSNLIGVLSEELSRLNIPFLLIDVEGGFHTLSERYQVAWVGNDPRANARHDPQAYHVIARLIEESGGRVVFDVSDRGDAPDLVAAMLRALFQFADGLPEESRVGVLVLIDEVQQFIPQDKSVRIQEILDISQRGRKRGLGLVLATQRPAIVDKTALSQCDTQLVGLLPLQNDKEAVASFFSGSPGGRALLERLPSLQQGFFYALGSIAKIPELVHVRKRITTHAGATPQVRPKPGFTADELSHALQGVGTPPSSLPVTAASRSAAPAASVSPLASTLPTGSPGGVAPSPSTPRRGPPVAAASPASAPAIPSAILAVPFRVRMDEARQTAQRLLAGPGHVLGVAKALNPFHAEIHEESFEAAFWPYLQCTVVAPQHHLLGGVQERTYQTFWDARFLSPVSFPSPFEPRLLRPFEPSLLDLDFRSLKVLMELTRSRKDMTAGDLVAATSKSPPTLSDAAVRSALQTLSGKTLVVRGADVGRAKSYRPSKNLEVMDIGSWDTSGPAPGPAPAGLGPVPLQPGQLRLPALLWKDGPGAKVSDDFPRALTTASLDGANLRPPVLFYLPFYRAVYRSSDLKATPQIFLINGTTGTGRRLEEREAYFAMS